MNGVADASRVTEAEYGWGLNYARSLLADVGINSLSLPQTPVAAIHPARRWADSGAMTLTGTPDGPPQMCPVPLAACADGIVAALQALSPTAAMEQIDGAALLGERAAIAGFTRRGAISAGGACRLLPAADGWLAVNLARTEDWELLPAWLQRGQLRDWEQVAATLRDCAVQESVESARLLGLAVALSPSDWRSAVLRAPEWCRAVAHFGQAAPAIGERARAPGAGSQSAGGGGGARAALRPPRVVDLSSLWAGPLCSRLLQLMGAQVVKVESRARPDGARQGPRAFFDLLNGGKESVALDFDSPRERGLLPQLLRQADIVIEGSRPRALRQLGIVAEEVLAANPALTWVGISGYGRGSPQEDWIAYGDDAAVAAGLSAVMQECTGEMMFCGDAIADPLTGLHAALAAWCSYRRGGGGLLSLSLSGVVAHAVRFAAPLDGESLAQRTRRWYGDVDARVI